MATTRSPVLVPPILQLSVEIRDLIYLFLLQAQYTSSTPAEARPRSTNPRDRYCPRRVSYQLDALPSTVPTLGLLSCCHQIRSELQHFLTREDTNERRAPIFRLNCTLEHFLISPTWSALPTSLAAVHRLEIDIQVRHMQRVNVSGTTAPLLMVPFPRVFELLHRLFNHGPHFYQRERRADVCIDDLTLIFHDEFTKREEQSQDVSSSSILDADAEPLQISLQRIEQCISGLDRYGLLRGRVKTVKIRFGDYCREIRASGGSVGRARRASSSEWLAWVYRWPKDDMFHPLDN